MYVLYGTPYGSEGLPVGPGPVNRKAANEMAASPRGRAMSASVGCRRATAEEIEIWFGPSPIAGERARSNGAHRECWADLYEMKAASSDAIDMDMGIS